MKLSIITATYNSAKTIANNVASVNEQTYDNIEHIIIDGASLDNTLDIIQTNSKRNLIIRSEPDKGIYDALNKGLALASGDIIGFLHSDDLFFSNQTIEKIVQAFSVSDRVDAVYGDLIFVNEKASHKVVRYWRSKPFTTKLLKKGWMPPHPTLFMRRQVYESHGLFNVNLKCAADYDYILRVFQDETLKFLYLPEIITKMQIGGVSTKGFVNIINKKIEDYKVLKSNHISYPLSVLLLKNTIKLPQLLAKLHKKYH
jgi:glycosyltransferase